jgi:hypothetical protein
MLADPSDTVIAWDDDSGTDDPPGPGRNAVLKSVLLTESGTYTISINSSKGYESMQELFTDGGGIDVSRFNGIGPYQLMVETGN